jgi:uncharacterized protein
MFLDLTDLALRTGERHERSYPVELAPILLGGVSYEVLLPQGVTVAVDRVAGGFLITVSTDAKVYGPCARCLSEVVLEVRAEQQEFAPTAQNRWEESDLSAFIDDMVVDVAGIAREAVILSLPAQVVCSPECLGLCPQCGKDLNQGPCECAPPGGDERWGALKDLRLDDDSGSAGDSGAADGSET